MVEEQHFLNFVNDYAIHFVTFGDDKTTDGINDSTGAAEKNQY